MLTYEQTVSRLRHKGHFLTLGYSTQAPLFTVKKELSALYRMHENAKKREYGARIREVEWAAFTPLVLSTTGGMARECTIFYKRLADRLLRSERPTTLS